MKQVKDLRKMVVDHNKTAEEKQVLMNHVVLEVEKIGGMR